MNLSLETLGRFHPLIVHFPIALLFGGGIIEIVRVKKDSPALALAARWIFGLGALFAAFAAGTGWILEEHSRFPLDVSELVEAHSEFAFVTTGAGIAAFLAELFWGTATESWRLWIRRVVAWITLLAIILTGHTGAIAVWGADWFS